MVAGLGDMGLVLGLAATGSAMGAGVAGMAAIGAWKKAYLQNKAAPFIIIAFVGAPLSQTIYGMILRNQIQAQAALIPPEMYLFQIILGAAAGLAIGVSAYYQGLCGAKACDALIESGKGFGNYIIVLGMTETVALFVLVFSITGLKNFATIVSSMPK
jgi:V/A-type H+/Na+-transporting ATPase subunit K